MVSNITTARMMAYDNSYTYTCALYDNLPYNRTYEICNEKTVCMFSGNIIKNNYYVINEPVEIDNGDAGTMLMLENLRLEASVVAEDELHEVEGEVADEDTILQGLMSDYVDNDTGAEDYAGVYDEQV